jgi:hypothetical protein
MKFTKAVSLMLNVVLFYVFSESIKSCLVDTTATINISDCGKCFCNSITDCDEGYKRYKCDDTLLFSYVFSGNPQQQQKQQHQ